jgi:hypothetical protein
MASWRQGCEWWREFRYLGARDVKRRVDHVTWAQEKLREAERFLWWHTHWPKFLLGAVATLVALLGIYFR